MCTLRFSAVQVRDSIDLEGQGRCVDVDRSVTKRCTLRAFLLQVIVYYDIGGVQPDKAQSAKADLGGAAAIEAFQGLLQQAGVLRTGLFYANAALLSEDGGAQISTLAA